MHIIYTNDYVYCMCITYTDMPTLLHEPIYIYETNRNGKFVGNRSRLQIVLGWGAD